MSSFIEQPPSSSPAASAAIAILCMPFSPLPPPHHAPAQLAPQCRSAPEHAADDEDGGIEEGERAGQRHREPVVRADELAAELAEFVAQALLQAELEEVDGQSAEPGRVELARLGAAGELAQREPEQGADDPVAAQLGEEPGVERRREQPMAQEQG